MVVAVKIWMDADTLVIFGASKIVRVCAGRAAIARILTGIGALMWVPVVTSVMVYHDGIKSIAVIKFFIIIYSIDS